MANQINTEIFYDSDWHDISADVLNRQQVNVTRGQQNEGTGVAAPGTATLLLNNGTSSVDSSIVGRYSTRNPRSDLFGKIGLNTPIRQSIGIPHVAAAFIDTVDKVAQVAPSVDSPTDEALLICTWGSPDPTASGSLPPGMTAGPSTADANTTLISAHQAISSIGATGTKTATADVAEDYLSSSTLLHGTNLNVDGTGGFSTVVGPITGVPERWWVVVSYFGWNDPDTGASIDDDEADRVVPHFPHDTDGSGWILMADTGAVFIGDAQADFFRKKVWIKKVKTQGQHFIRIENPDSALDSIQSVFLEVSGVSDWSVRFNHEVASWPPEWGLAGQNDSYVPIETAGILQRIGLDDSPLKDTVHRFMTEGAGSTNLIGYWPMNDTDGSKFMAAKVGLNLKVNRSAGYEEFRTLPKFGSAEMHPWLPVGIETQAEGYFIASVRDSVSGGFAFDFLYRATIASDDSADTPVQLVLVVFTDLAGYNFQFNTGSGVTALVVNPATGSTINSATASQGNLFDGRTHHIRCRVLDDTGTNQGVFIDIDGTNIVSVLANTGESVPGVINKIGLLWNVQTSANLPVKLSQLALWNESPPGLDDSVLVYNGHEGETTGNRFTRLCRENDIEYAAIGDPNDSQPMGPQQPLSFYELLEEIVLAESGHSSFVTIGEARESPSLLLIPQRHYYNKSTALELDYSAQHISDPFHPITDTQNTANSVTVSGTFAESVTKQKTSGPLNINKPKNDPTGAGKFEREETFNVLGIFGLSNVAGWWLLNGTINEDRFPLIKLDDRSLETRTPNVTVAAKDLDVGDRFTLDNLPIWLPPELVDLSTLGYSETYSIETFERELVAIPNSPNHISELEHTDYLTIGSDGTRRNPGSGVINTSNTSLTFQITNGYFWVHEGNFDIMVGGERMTVTAIGAPSGDTQLFTVVRSVNGIVKSHSNDVKVELFHKSYIGY